MADMNNNSGYKKHCYAEDYVVFHATMSIPPVNMVACLQVAAKNATLKTEVIWLEE